MHEGEIQMSKQLKALYIFFIIISFLIPSNKIYSQWFGGFHHGNQDSHMSEYFDGHRYHYNISSGDTIVIGKAIVNSGGEMMIYSQIDVDNDNQPDFYLDFGPWWYQPESDAVRPENLEEITIKGKVFELQNDLNIILVTEINDKEWKKFSNGYHWSGNWIKKMHSGNQFVYSPIDSLNHVEFNSNFMMMGMMWPDSFYCDFNSLPSFLMPEFHEDSLLRGYHFDFINDEGKNMMYGDYGWGMGMMRFNNNVNFNFHYNRHIFDSIGISHNDLMLKYWNEPDSTWNMVSDYSINENNNTISFSTNSVNSYYGLFFASTITDIGEDNSLTPDKFALSQNYPNPFNPITNIKFSIPIQSHVTLKIFNIMGQEIKTLTDRNYSPGVYEFKWDGTNNKNISVASGLYIYQIKSSDFIERKKMLFIK